MKIALAMIVKGSDTEAMFLDQCLQNVSPHVDGIFLTSTYSKSEKETKPIEFIGEKYNATISKFKWTNDFSEARNYNFSQITKDYDYILWCDADDVFDGLVDLKGLIEKNPSIDAFAFNYIYAFDEFNNPVDVHKKTQLVRNDGCVTWENRIHENFKENRALNTQFVNSIKRLHKSTETHLEESRDRNLVVAKIEAKEKANDPKSMFNLGNALIGVGKYKEAKKAFEKFLKKSQSNEEKFIIHQRLAAVENNLGNKEDAIQNLQLAIGLQPYLPDAYLEMGYLCSDYNMLDRAEEMLMIGLLKKPMYNKMIVYNPRDYDYRPLKALAKVYFNKSRPDLALPLLEGCVKINPQDKVTAGLVEELKVEVKRMEKVIEASKRIQGYGDDKEKIMFEINKLDEDLQSHPEICRIKNHHFVKTESNGKEIAYYCGHTNHTWNPEMAKTKGIGGSEEAVVNLAKQWVKMGYTVTVFNTCGPTPMKVNGVSYKPYWHYNPRDKYDHMILWRSPRLADHELNVTNLYVDLHDVVSEGEFTENRLEKIKKIFVKTKSHRILFPNVPDEKFAVIPNGQDFELFDNVEIENLGKGVKGFKIHEKIKKDPYLLINTSSPDRSLDVLPKLFKRVKNQVPQARMKWAYGFDIYDQSFPGDKSRMEWKDKVLKEMAEAGIENMGRLSQAECAKLYLEGRILAYPSEFYEIDCISVKKAQACGCMPVTTDFAAFEESVQFGVKIKSKKDKTNWSKPYQFAFGLEDEKAQDQWVEAVVRELRKPMVEQTEMKEWAKKFAWPLIAKQWTENL